MQKPIVSAALAALLALTLAACGTTGGEKVAAEPAKPTLSEEAKQALANAEADIKKAKAEYALWTTAEDALKKAQEAAKAGDSAAVLKLSAQASKLSKLGLEQTKYPSTELK